MKLWQRLLGRPVSEYGRLCHGDGGHEWGDRRRRVLMLPILTLFPTPSATRSPVLSGRMHLLVDGIRPEAQAEHDPQ